MKRKREVWHGSGAKQRSNHRDAEHGTSDGELSYFLHVTELDRSTTCMRPPALAYLNSSFSRAQKGPDLEHVPYTELIRSYLLYASRRRTCPFFPVKLFLRFVVVANG